MGKKKRDRPFVWPSWISKMVSGEDMCDWKYWFKSHFMYDKKPSDFNLALWTVNHTAMLKERRDGLLKLGYKVTVEDQNSFKLDIRIPKKEPTLREATLFGISDNGYENYELAYDFTVSGKADIVAAGQEENMQGAMEFKIFVEDCKSGRSKTSDFIQVIFYMIFLPLSIPEYKGMDFDGTIVYKLGVADVNIPHSAAEDESLKLQIWKAMKLITGDESNCRRSPSKKECNWCDITKDDCPGRIG